METENDPAWLGLKHTLSRSLAAIRCARCGRVIYKVYACKCGDQIYCPACAEDFYQEQHSTRRTKR